MFYACVVSYNLWLVSPKVKQDVDAHHHLLIYHFHRHLDDQLGYEQVRGSLDDVRDDDCDQLSQIGRAHV